MMAAAITEPTTSAAASSVPAALRVAVVIPAYNEEGKIGRVLQKIPHRCADAVIVVDDCSRDRTAAEAERAGATVLRHATNSGVGASIRTGIEHARTHGFDVVAVLSGDDQHDPNDLPAMLRLLQSGEYDFVQGSRRLAGARMVRIGWFRRIATAVYPLVFRMATGFPATDATNGFRAFRVSILDDARIDLGQPWLDRYELEPYLFYQAVVTGKRVKEAPATVIYHDSGTTKMRGIGDWWRILRPVVLLRLGLKR